MRITLLFLALPLIFLSSCARYYYKPNAVNSPLFTKGGQAHVSIAGGIGSGNDNEEDRTTFADLQASFSPINHLGFIGSYSTFSYRPYTPDAASGHVSANAHLVEGGVGGYYASGGRKVKMVAELYVGGGVGKISSDVDMDVTRYFVQPGIGMRSPWVEAVFNLRWVSLNYSHLDDNGRGNTYLLDHQLVDIYNRGITKGNFIFVEPALTIRGGYKFIKVQLQLVGALPVSVVPWNYNGTRYTVGLQFAVEDLLEMAKP